MAITEQGKVLLQRLWAKADEEDGAPSPSAFGMTPGRKMVLDWAAQRGVDRAEFMKAVQDNSTLQNEVGAFVEGMTEMATLGTYGLGLEYIGLKEPGKPLTGGQAFEFGQVLPDMLLNQMPEGLANMFRHVSPARAAGSLVGGSVVGRAGRELVSGGLKAIAPRGSSALVRGSAEGLEAAQKVAQAAPASVGKLVNAFSNPKNIHSLETLVGFGILEAPAQMLRSTLKGEDIKDEDVLESMAWGVAMGAGFETVFRGFPAALKALKAKRGSKVTPAAVRARAGEIRQELESKGIDIDEAADAWGRAVNEGWPAEPFNGLTRRRGDADAMTGAEGTRRFMHPQEIADDLGLELKDLTQTAERLGVPIEQLADDLRADVDMLRRAQLGGTTSYGPERRAAEVLAKRASVPFSGERDVVAENRQRLERLGILKKAPETPTESAGGPEGGTRPKTGTESEGAGGAQEALPLEQTGRIPEQPEVGKAAPKAEPEGELPLKQTGRVPKQPDVGRPAPERTPEGELPLKRASENPRQPELPKREADEADISHPIFMAITGDKSIGPQGSGRVIITPSAKTPGEVQATFFDNAQALADYSYKSLTEARADLRKMGFDLSTERRAVDMDNTEVFPRFDVGPIPSKAEVSGTYELKAQEPPAEPLGRLTDEAKRARALKRSPSQARNAEQVDESIAAIIEEIDNLKNQRSAEGADAADIADIDKRIASQEKRIVGFERRAEALKTPPADLQPDDMTLKDLILNNRGINERSLVKRQPGPQGMQPDEYKGEFSDGLWERGAGSKRSVMSQGLVNKKNGGINADELANLINDDPQLTGIKHELAGPGGTVTDEDILRALSNQETLEWSVNKHLDDILDEGYAEEARKRGIDPDDMWDMEAIAEADAGQTMGGDAFEPYIVKAVSLKDRMHKLLVEEIDGVDPKNPNRQKAAAEYEKLSDELEAFMGDIEAELGRVGREQIEGDVQARFKQGAEARIGEMLGGADMGETPEIPGARPRPKVPMTAKQGGARTAGLEGTALGDQKIEADKAADMRGITQQGLFTANKAQRLQEIETDLRARRKAMEKAEVFSDEHEALANDIISLEQERAVLMGQDPPTSGASGGQGPLPPEVVRENRLIHALERSVFGGQKDVARAFRRRITAEDSPTRMTATQRKEYMDRLNQLVRTKTQRVTREQDSDLEFVRKFSEKGEKQDLFDEPPVEGEAAELELPPELDKELSPLTWLFQTPRSESNLAGTLIGKLGTRGGEVPEHLRPFLDGRESFVGGSKILHYMEAEIGETRLQLQKAAEKAKLTVKDGRAVSAALDGQSSPEALDPRLREVYTLSRELTNSLAQRLGLPEEQRISDYFAHIFRGDLGRLIANQVAEQTGVDIARSGVRVNWKGKPTAELNIPKAKFFRHLLERQGAEGYEMDWAKVMTAYSDGALRKIYLDQFLQESRVLLDLAAKNSKTPHLAKEFADYVHYVAGGTTSTKKAMARALENSTIFNDSVDRLMSALGPAAEPMPKDPKALLKWYQDLVKMAQLPEGSETMSEGVRRRRAEAALWLDEIRLQMENPEAGPAIIPKLYRVMALHKLGANVAHFVTNITQSIINTPGAIGPEATAKGMWHFLNATLGGQKGRLIQVGKVATPVRDLINEVVHEAPAYREFLTPRSFRGVAGKAEGVLMAPSKYSETWNRGTAVIGAYEQKLVELGDLVNTNPGKAHRIALDRALDVDFDTQFQFNKAGTPKLLRSPMAKLLLMFQSYTMHQVNFSYDIIKRAIMAPTPENFSKLASHIAGYGLVIAPFALRGYNADDRFAHPAIDWTQRMLGNESYGEPPLVMLTGPWASMAVQSARFLTGRTDFEDYAQRSLMPAQMSRTYRAFTMEDNATDAAVRSLTGLRQVREPGLKSLAESVMKGIGIGQRTKRKRARKRKRR